MCRPANEETFVPLFEGRNLKCYCMKIYGLLLQATSLHDYPFHISIFFYPLHYANTSTFTGFMNIFDYLDLKIGFILS